MISVLMNTTQKPVLPLYDAIGFGINSIKNKVTDDDSLLAWC